MSHFQQLFKKEEQARKQLEEQIEVKTREQAKLIISLDGKNG